MQKHLTKRCYLHQSCGKTKTSAFSYGLKATVYFKINLKYNTKLSSLRKYKWLLVLIDLNFWSNSPVWQLKRTVTLYGVPGNKKRELPRNSGLLP